VASLWTLGHHKPVIPLVTFPTPLRTHCCPRKDRWAALSRPGGVLGRRGQAGFSPFRLHEISVLVEPAIGHLRCCFIDVPPQPNCPADGSCGERLNQKRFSQDGICIPFRPHPLRWLDARVRVFHFRGLRPSPLRYTPRANHRRRPTVKLKRVFFPRCSVQARSLGCGFARMWIGTVGISLIHSCASRIKRRGIWLP